MLYIGGGGGMEEWGGTNGNNDSKVNQWIKFFFPHRLLFKYYISFVVNIKTDIRELILAVRHSKGRAGHRNRIWVRLYNVWQPYGYGPYCVALYRHDMVALMVRYGSYDSCMTGLYGSKAIICLKKRHQHASSCQKCVCEVQN